MTGTAPDAALLAHCRALAEIYEELDRQETSTAADDTDELLTITSNAYYAAAAIVTSLKPVTLEGLKAKAAAVRTLFLTDVFVGKGRTLPEPMDAHEAAAWRLVNDVLAWGDTAV